jgi:hypothetical protein
MLLDTLTSCGARVTYLEKEGILWSFVGEKAEEEEW